MRNHCSRAGGLPVATTENVAGRSSAAILTQPVDQTVVELLPATFSVVATGSPPARLQWFRNNQALPKATNTTYTLPATALTDDGAIFRVEASNVVANVLQRAVSSDAVLHVTADTTGPLLLSGTSLSSTLVQLTFSEGNLAPVRLEPSPVHGYRPGW